MRHNINECSLAHDLCLLYGSRKHRISQCPHNRQLSGEVVSVSVGQQKLVMSGPTRLMVLFQPRQPPSSQQQLYQQAQKGNIRPMGPVRGKGKAYTLTTDQAEVSGEVVTCIILVHSIPAYVSLDSGATHCFIPSKFISKHDISCNTVQ